MPIHERKYLQDSSPGSSTIINQQLPMDRLNYGQPGFIPIKEEFPGQFNFELLLNYQGKGKSYVVSLKSLIYPLLIIKTI